MSEVIDTRLREPTIEEREMGYHLVRRGGDNRRQGTESWLTSIST
jgi:hypothetical protein